MEWIFPIILIFLFGLLCGGGYILQRDKYWKRVWEELGKPEVSGIKELKKTSKGEKEILKSLRAYVLKIYALFYFLKYVIIKLAKYF